MDTPRRMDWSWYRDRIFSFCPRSYMLHYEGGRGGFDLYAERERRLVYRLKKLSDVPRWLDELATEAVRGCVPWRGRQFRHELFRQFANGRSRALAGDWVDDPAFLNLSELYYQECDPEALFAGAQEELRRRAKLLENSPLKDLFADLNELTLVKTEYPLMIEMNAVRVWTAPVQIWHSGNTLFFLNWMKSAEGMSCAGALQCVWAMRHLKIPPDRIYFAAYGLTDGAYREYPARELDISPALAWIEQRALEFSNSDYPPRTENCPHCRFREYCRG